MAERKYYIFGAIIFFCFLSNLGYCEPQEVQSVSSKKGQYIFSLRSADRNICEKVSSEPNRESDRFQDGLQPVSISLSKLKKELGKKAIYKGRDVVSEKGLWYLEYPFDTAVSTLEKIDDFRAYLSRMVGGDTDIDVSEDRVNFQIRKRF